MATNEGLLPLHHVCCGVSLTLNRSYTLGPMPFVSETTTFFLPFHNARSEDFYTKKEKTLEKTINPYTVVMATALL